MITNQHIHLRSSLTDNILIKDDLGQLDKHQNYWARIDRIVILNQVQERFDVKGGGAEVVGHFVVESAPFVIERYPELQSSIEAALRACVERVVANKGWAPITQPPTKYRLDS